jgi:protein-S-isoprenylcysteine O-methyltransferase Ste14
MIANSLLLLLLCNFVAIGLLPMFFFRKDGKYNLRWLLTGAPFFVAPVALLLGRMDVLLPMFNHGIQLLAVPLAVLSISLMAMTVGSHRIPLALWHQDNDAPQELVTWGPYTVVRHPFYTSFILALLAAAIAFPHPLTLVCLLYGTASLTLTAIREERRLSSSVFAAEYTRYMNNSGRFFPRILP